MPNADNQAVEPHYIEECSNSQLQHHPLYSGSEEALAFFECRNMPFLSKEMTDKTVCVYMATFGRPLYMLFQSYTEKEGVPARPH